MRQLQIPSSGEQAMGSGESNCSLWQKTPSLLQASRGKRKQSLPSTHEHSYGCGVYFGHSMVSQLEETTGPVCAVSLCVGLLLTSPIRRLSARIKNGY